MPEEVYPTFEQGIDETIRLLNLDDYRTYKDVTAICFRQIIQAFVQELISLGEDQYTIAAGTGLSEKTIRFYRRAKHAPKLLHLMLLQDYVKKVRARRR